LTGTPLTSQESVTRIDVGTVFTIQVVLLAIALFGINHFDLQVGEASGPALVFVLSGLGLGTISYGVAFMIFRWAYSKSASLLEFSRRVRSTAAHLKLTAILAISAFAAIGEEMFFRGFLQNWLQQLTSEWLAVLGAAVLFAAMHGLSLIYFSISLGMGLLLGAAFALSECIALVIFWHFSYDVLSFLVLIRYPGLLNLSSDKEDSANS
jgi:membrane protease YdiL (CAAX protease family)